MNYFCFAEVALIPSFSLITSEAMQIALHMMASLVMTTWLFFPTITRSDSLRRPGVLAKQNG